MYAGWFPGAVTSSHAIRSNVPHRSSVRRKLDAKGCGLVSTPPWLSAILDLASMYPALGSALFSHETNSYRTSANHHRRRSHFLRAVVDADAGHMPGGRVSGLRVPDAGQFKRRAHSDLVDGGGNSRSVSVHVAGIPLRSRTSGFELARTVVARLDGLPRNNRKGVAGRRNRALRTGLCCLSADTCTDDLEPRRWQAAAALPDGVRLVGRHCGALHWPQLWPPQAVAL